MKAYAISCEKHYPGIVAHYAAEDADKAMFEALISMRKVGSRAKLADLDCERAPQFDGLATKKQLRGCIEEDIKQRQVAV